MRVLTSLKDYYSAQQDMMMRYHGTQQTQYPSSDNRPTLEDAEGLLHLAAQVTGIHPHPVPDRDHDSSLEAACMSREARYATRAPPMKKRAIDPSLFNLEGDGRRDQTGMAVDQDLTQTKEYGLLSLLAEKALEESNAIAAAAAAREQLHDEQKHGGMNKSMAEAEEDRPAPRSVDVSVTKETKRSAVLKEAKKTDANSMARSPTNEEDIEFKIRALVHGEHRARPKDSIGGDGGKDKGQEETIGVLDSTTDTAVDASSAVRNTDTADSSESVPPEATIDENLATNSKLEDEDELSEGKPVKGVPETIEEMAADVVVADERQPDVAAPAKTSVETLEVGKSSAATPTQDDSDPVAAATAPIGSTRTADVVSENVGPSALDGTSSAKATTELAAVDVDDSMVVEAIDEASAVQGDREDGPSDATKDNQPEAGATGMDVTKEQNLTADEKGPCAPPSESATDSEVLHAPSDWDGDEIPRSVDPAPPASVDSLQHSQNLCAATEEAANFNNAESTTCEQAAYNQIETKDETERLTMEDDTERLTMDGETGKVDNPEKSHPLEAYDCVMNFKDSQVKSDGSDHEFVGRAADIEESSDPRVHADLTQTQALEKPEDETSDFSKSEKNEHSIPRSSAEHVLVSVLPSNEVGAGAHVPVDNNNSEAVLDNEMMSSRNETELSGAVSSGVEAESVESAVDKTTEPSESSKKEEAKDAIPAIASTSLAGDEASNKIGIDGSIKGESSSLGNNKEVEAHTPQTGVHGVQKDEPDEEMMDSSTAEMKFDSEMPHAAEVGGANDDGESDTTLNAERAGVVLYPAPETNEEARLTDSPHTESESLNSADLEAQKMPDESEPAEGPGRGEKPASEPNAKEVASLDDKLTHKSPIDESSDVDDKSVCREDSGVDPLACAEDLYWDAKESDKLEDEIKANAIDMMSINSDPKSRDGDDMQHIVDPITKIPVSAQVAQANSETKLAGDLKSLKPSMEESEAKSTEVSGLVASDLTNVVTDVNLIASTEGGSPSGGGVFNQAVVAAAAAAAAAAEKLPPNDSEQRSDGAGHLAKFDENTRDDEGLRPTETKKVDVIRTNDSPVIEHESTHGTTDLTSSQGESQGMSSTAESSHFDEATTVAENIPLDGPNLLTDGAEQPTETAEKTNVAEALSPAETSNVDSTSLMSSSLVEEPLVEDELAQDNDGPQPQGLSDTINNPRHSTQVALHVAVNPPLRQNETSEHQSKVSSQTSGIADADIPANSELGVVDDQDGQAKHLDEVSQSGQNSAAAMQDRNAPQCQIGGGEPSVPMETKLPEKVPPNVQAKNQMAASSPTDSTNLCAAGPSASMSVDDTLVEDHPEDMTSCVDPADPKEGRRKTGVADEKCSNSPSSDAAIDKHQLKSYPKREDPTRKDSEPSANRTSCEDGGDDEVAPCTSVANPKRNEESRDTSAMTKSSSVGLLSMDNGSTAGHFSLDNVLSPGADLIDISAGLIGGPAQQQEALNSTLALAGDSAMFDDLDAFDFDDADKHMVGDSGANSDALTSMALASDELLGSLVASNAERKNAGAGPPNTSQVREGSSEFKSTDRATPTTMKATGSSTAKLSSGESEQSRATLDERKAQPSISDSASPKKDGKKPSIRLRFIKKRIGRELPTKKRRQESPRAHDAPNQRPNLPVVVKEVVNESKPKKKRSSIPSPTRLPQSGAVSLRGKLTRHSDGTHKIVGTWALGLDTILADPDNSKGVALDFEYEHSPNSAEGLDFPSSGTYSGWFHILVEDGCQVKSLEKDVELKYVKNSQGGYNVQGQGSNVYGKFTVKGLLTQDGTITMCRQFVPSPRPPSRKRKGVDGSSSTKKARKGDTSSTSRPSTAEAMTEAAPEESKGVGGALYESVLLPDGPSSLPGTWTLGTSKKVPQYYTSSVLAGWVEQLIPRKDSKSRHARHEKFYLCPDGGRFRSLVQARSYAERLANQVNREEDGKLTVLGQHLDGSAEASPPEGGDSERIEGSIERSVGISNSDAADTAHTALRHVNQEPREDNTDVDDDNSAPKRDSVAQSQLTADTEHIDGSTREETQLDNVLGPLTEGVEQETNHRTDEEAKSSGLLVEDKEQNTEEGCAADRVKHAALIQSPKSVEVEIEAKVDQSTKPTASADETSESAQLTRPAALANDTSESAAQSLTVHESKTVGVTRPAKPANVSPKPSPLLTEMDTYEESKTDEVAKPAASVDESLQPPQAPLKIVMGMESEAEDVATPFSAADETSKFAEKPIGMPLGVENRLDEVVASAASAASTGEKPFADESAHTDLGGERKDPSGTEGNAAGVELEKTIPSRGQDATETKATGNTDETPVSLSEEPSLPQDIRKDMPATDEKDTSSMNMNVTTGTEKKGGSNFATARDDPTLEDGPLKVNAGDADVSDGFERSGARPGPRRGVSFSRNLSLEEQSNAGRRNYVYQKAKQSAPHLKRPSSTDVEMTGHSKKRRRSSSVKRVSSRVDVRLV